MLARASLAADHELEHDEPKQREADGLEYQDESAAEHVGLGEVGDHVAHAAIDAARDGFFDVSVVVAHVRSSVELVLSSGESLARARRRCAREVYRIGTRRQRASSTSKPIASLEPHRRVRSHVDDAQERRWLTLDPPKRTMR